MLPSLEISLLATPGQCPRAGLAAAFSNWASILDWNSDFFPLVYAVMVGLVALVSRVLRQRRDQQETHAEGIGVPEIRDPFELAMLAGGSLHTAHTALVRLLLSGSLTARTGLLQRSMLMADGPVPEHPIERALYDAVRKAGKMSFREAIHGLPKRMTFPAMEQQLRRAGLLSPKYGIRLTVEVLPLGLLLILGLAILSVVFSKGTDVSFTISLILLNLIWILNLLETRLTRLGRRTLHHVRVTHRTGGLEPAADFALFGPALLEALPLPEGTADALRKWSG